MSRYAGMLSALLLTALLFWLAPGLIAGHMADSGRTGESLKPPASRTMVVWVTSWQAGDRSLLSGLCSAFEKQRPGLRIYLRRADAEELHAPDAVLPDVVLHCAGEIVAPEEVLLPLAAPEVCPEGVLWSGRSRNVLYAVPLWYSPNVLCLPRSWLEAEPESSAGEAAPQQTRAYFALETPMPTAAARPLDTDNLPWRKLTEPGCLWADSAIGFTQLMMLCPASLRQELSRCAPCLTEPPKEAAVIRSLQSHLAAQDGRIPLALPTVTSLRVRYASLTGESEDAAAFLNYLCTAAEAAGEQHLAHTCGGAKAKEELLWQTLVLAQEGLLLPNAFAIPQQGIEELCLEDFTAAADPVATLLKLR